jgi:hypothetical protein
MVNTELCPVGQDVPVRMRFRDVPEVGPVIAGDVRDPSCMDRGSDAFEQATDAARRPYGPAVVSVSCPRRAAHTGTKP